MKRFLRALLPAALILLPLTASAITFLPPCTKTGDCGVSDMLAVLVNIAEYLLGISGAVALFFFVLGGFRYVLSRGEPSKVQQATDTLKNAVIGIAIIFLSGVIVRFATRALTGGTSAIPTVGESCDPGTSKSKADGTGLWLSIPAGIDGNGKVIPEQLLCVKKDDCKDLNAKLEARQRTEKYDCINVSQGKSCVRGLCPSKPADFACCLK